jgi:hypothetical protein
MRNIECLLVGELPLTGLRHASGNTAFALLTRAAFGHLAFVFAYVVVDRLTFGFVRFFFRRYPVGSGTALRFCPFGCSRRVARSFGFDGHDRLLEVPAPD